jgi:regulatory protein
MVDMIDSVNDHYRKALNSALRILARRDHSTVELAQKLMLRGHAEDVVRRVITECQRLNYLDDRHARRQLVDAMKRKGFGIHRIRRELIKRGLAGEEAEAGSAASMPPEEERSVARRVALKKWNSLQQGPAPDKQKPRLLRYLQSRGFSDAVIYEVMKTITEGAFEDPPPNS